MIMYLFIQKKLKIDNVDEYICGKVIGDDEIEVVKVVLSLVIGEIIQGFSVSKGHNIDHFLIVHLDL